MLFLTFRIAITSLLAMRRLGSPSGVTECAPKKRAKVDRDDLVIQVDADRKNDITLEWKKYQSVSGGMAYRLPGVWSMEYGVY